MANEAENAIYNRLASAPSFHPASVDLFTRDWMLEPGDIVSVRSGDESYAVPIYSMNLDWRGDTKVTVESTGNQTRDPLPALRRKQYGGGAAAYRQQKRFTANLEQMENELGAKIGLVVAENDQGGNVIRSASIVAAINASSSEVVIQADHVDLRGYVTAEYLSVNHYLTADAIESGEAVLSYLEATTIQCANIDGDITSDNGTIGNLTATGDFVYRNETATWRSASVVTSSNLSASHSYMYLEDGVQRTASGRLVGGTTTIYYLGHT